MPATNAIFPSAPDGGVPAQSSNYAASSEVLVQNLRGFDLWVVHLNVTVITLPDAGDELDFYFQTTYDGGVNYVDMENVHYGNGDNGNTDEKVLYFDGRAYNIAKHTPTDAALVDNGKNLIPPGQWLKVNVDLTESGDGDARYNYSVGVWAR